MSFLMSSESSIPDFVKSDNFDENDIIRVTVHKIVLHIANFSTKGNIDGDKERVLKVQADHLISQVSDENLLRLRDAIASSTSSDELEKNITSEFSRHDDMDICNLRSDKKVKILGGIVDARFDVSTTGHDIMESIAIHLSSTNKQYCDDFVEKISKSLEYRNTHTSIPSFSF